MSPSVWSQIKIIPVLPGYVCLNDSHGIHLVLTLKIPGVIKQLHPMPRCMFH